MRSWLVLQLIKKFPAFYGTRKFITALRSTRFSCCVMLPLETTPPAPRDPSGGVFYLRIVLSSEETSRLWAFHNILFFHGEELLSPRPTPKLEHHPLSAVWDCLLNLFAATLHIGGRSSIRNLRTHHDVMTGTHKHGNFLQIMLLLFIHTFTYISVSQTGVPWNSRVP